MIGQTFTRYSAERLELHSSRIQDCLAKLTYEQIWMRHSDQENAVGNLVLHLCGNVRQWIGHGVAGRPDDRQRDTEFAARGDIDAEQLVARLTSTIGDAVSVIRGLTPEQLDETITVQENTLTKLEAVYRILDHFSGHTGQIIYATKLLTGKDLGFFKHLSGPAR